ncbi:MAG: response regulator [Methanoregula sp.]|jgi:DNA-binding response OmpR family regulator|uniref:response regulator n=1 Tax=Methanoregula sp. TaxID=2052170 RepID=UPI0025FE3882|nr:response regulator [Methanoregula sp.]MCK9630625.1 response regulator [Methanoregula sp.]
MPAAIKILLVDDEPALLEMGKIFLEQQSGEIIVETAASARNALLSLSCGSYDAVVSDYEMPEMDGIGFLKHLRSAENNIPFILFTGRGREEVAIEALNHGATFYLQKGYDARAQYTELAHKIRQAVRQFRAERSVRESERRVEHLLNFLPDPTIAMDMEGRLIMWNRATEEMTGVMASEVMGKGDYEYTIPFFGNKRPLIADFLRTPDNAGLARY